MPDSNDARPDGQSVDADALKAELAKLQSQLADVTARAAAAEEKFNEAKATRDKAKAREKEEAEKRGEYEKAAALMKEELEEAKRVAAEAGKTAAELERLRAVETEHRAYLDSERTALLEQLPDDAREKFKATDLPTLRDIVALTDRKQVPVNRGKAGGKQGASLDDLRWDEMTPEQHTEFLRANGHDAMTRKILADKKKN